MKLILALFFVTGHLEADRENAKHSKKNVTRKNPYFSLARLFDFPIKAMTRRSLSYGGKGHTYRERNRRAQRQK